ncbi:toxin-antitoxin system YwqK family antitoxin [Flagellimonas sp. CMM7]|uniref:toxin-antitoxin system YwqK family antitoxin n=1 Tax=Flagellimonas sp. CMM7 TaxID=2654676 RepID=UPI0013D492EA|nr:hypothetical protein [Flagellimonas sp. CMM7]UII80624.1 hypothetical protein LV704_03700 [Flagellimonas sp. CMM7]
MQLSNIEKHINEQVKSDVKENALDCLYAEYHENGRIKIEGQFEECNTTKECAQSKTQHYYSDELKTGLGKKHGLWLEYYENGIVKSKRNYHCGLQHGNSLLYRQDKKLLSSHYHVFGKEISVHKFHKAGSLELSKAHFYSFSEGFAHKLKMTLHWEFYKDGSLKIQRETQFLGNDKERQAFKEYYINGVLKTETRFLNQKRDGVHREYHKNSNPKYKGVFKDGKPINQHYYHNLNGQRTSTEYWYNGKLLGIEKNNDVFTSQ